MGCEVVGTRGLRDAGTHWTWELRHTGMQGHGDAGSRGLIDKGGENVGSQGRGT